MLSSLQKIKICYIAMTNYTNTYAYAYRIQRHNKDEWHSFFLEKYTSHFIWKGSKGLLKVLLWEGVGDWTELQHIDPHTSGLNSVSFLFSWAAQLGAWGPASLGHVPHSNIFSPTGLISNWLNFLCIELYNSSTPTFLWASQIALIQPVHGQGYILIFLDRMHLLFTLVHFLFWQPSRVGGQYTTDRPSTSSSPNIFLG